MSSLLETLQHSLGPGTIDTLSRQIGADRGSTQKALAAALPVLIGGLARNAEKPQGAAALASALDRDHDGSILDDLGSLLGGGGQGSSGGGGGLGGLLAAAAGSLLTGGGGGGGGIGGLGKALDGGGILGHILGSRRSTVEAGVQKASGLDAAQVGQLLMLLAPLVMGALGKLKQKNDLDAGGLRDLLQKDRSQVESRVGAKSKGGSLIDLLDRDDDGSVADDIADIAGKLGAGDLLKGLFR